MRWKTAWTSWSATERPGLQRAKRSSARNCVTGGSASKQANEAADQAMFRHLGVEPSDYAVLALKSSVHFRADFGPIAGEILVVAAPGPNVADPARLPFTKLRQGVRTSPRQR